MLIRLIDTAGIRRGKDEVERIGIDRARKALQDADMALFVLDSSADIIEADHEIFNMLGENTVVVLNKCDLPQKTSPDKAMKVFGKDAVAVCALSGVGRDALLKKITPPEIRDVEECGDHERTASKHTRGRIGKP